MAMSSSSFPTATATATASFPNWVMLERFVFRRDDDKSFPDDSKATLRASGSGSHKTPLPSPSVSPTLRRSPTCTCSGHRARIRRRWWHATSWPPTATSFSYASATSSSALFRLARRTTSSSPRPATTQFPRRYSKPSPHVPTSQKGGNPSHVPTSQKAASPRLMLRATATCSIHWSFDPSASCAKAKSLPSPSCRSSETSMLMSKPDCACSARPYPPKVKMEMEAGGGISWSCQSCTAAAKSTGTSSTGPLTL
uniref:Uncharacterized protein n=1 Tax=Oryza glaberrima TaxID=4538 RepID=I1PDH0_ORYGL